MVLNSPIYWFSMPAMIKGGRKGLPIEAFLWASTDF
ncbi:hypothetical protein KCX57_14825 [Pseudomonas hunanensis]